MTADLTAVIGETGREMTRKKESQREFYGSFRLSPGLDSIYFCGFIRRSRHGNLVERHPSF